MLILKPQDLLVLLKIIALSRYGGSCSPSQIAAELHMSRSEVNESFRRAEAARLFDIKKRRINISALEEVLIHGVKYFLPAIHGPITRGIPTSYAAAPLKYKFDAGENPPVWEHAAGTVRGYKIEPLYKSATKAALADSQLYELLAIVDGIRDGTARERNAAIEELRQRLEAYQASIRSQS